MAAEFPTSPFPHSTRIHPYSERERRARARGNGRLHARDGRLAFDNANNLAII